LSLPQGLARWANLLGLTGQHSGIFAVNFL
jgi:hypothetical protein